AVDPQPMHRPACEDLILSNDRHVVFRLTGDDASLAADARIEVDRHRPGAVRILEGLIQRLFALFWYDLSGVAVELIENRLANEIAPKHAILVLGGCRLIGITGLRQRGNLGNPGSVRSAGRVG